MHVLENGGTGGDDNINGLYVKALSGGVYYQKRVNNSSSNGMSMQCDWAATHKWATTITTYNDHLKNGDGNNLQYQSGLNSWGEEEEGFNANVKRIEQGQK